MSPLDTQPLRIRRPDDPVPCCYPDVAPRDAHLRWPLTGSCFDGMVVGKHGSVRIEEGPLRTYLQSHLAMSHAGEEIATGLRDRTDDAAIRAFLNRFVQEVEEERAVLQDLLDEVADEGLIRRGLDVVAEGVGRAGRLAQSASPGPFAELEALAIGVWGKRLLWGTLRHLAQVDETFRRVPVDELSDRAERQELELLRLRDDAIVPALAPQLAVPRDPT